MSHKTQCQLFQRLCRFLLPRCISRFIRASALIRSSPEEWSILISRMVSTLYYFCSPMTPSQALTDPTIPKKGSQGSQPNGDRCGGFSVESYYTGLEIAARITTTPNFLAWQEILPTCSPRTQSNTEQVKANHRFLTQLTTGLNILQS
jgi:hypothetical protein